MCLCINVFLFWSVVVGFAFTKILKLIYNIGIFLLFFCGLFTICKTARHAAMQYLQERVCKGVKKTYFCALICLP